MKSTIRELESSLCREREYNPQTHKINIEYLVNVVKSFLLTKNATEHTKLIPVLCSLLHFQSEEIKQINEIWSVNKHSQSSSGLLGWLLPTTTINATQHSLSSSTGGGNNNSSVDVYRDGIGGLDIY